MSYTTTAEVLRRVFTKLNDAIPTSNTGVMLFSCWAKVLGGEGRSEFNIVSSIADILSVLNKLESQINNSSLLDDFLKSSAHVVVNNFKPLFGFQSMNTHAFNYKGNCNPSVVGQLGIIGLSIKDEFSEPKMSDADRRFVLDTLNEIKELLISNDIPVDLKVSLSGRIDTVIWWISRPDIMNLQDILEKYGSVLIVAKQIEEKTADTSSKEAGTKIMEKARSAFGVLATAMKFMITNADKVQQLEQVYENIMITGPGPSS